MTTIVTDDLATKVIVVLQSHEAELRSSGICRLSLFGSVARGEAGPESDVDLAVEFEPAARIGLFALSALQRRLSEILGHRVDLIPEPVGKARLQRNINRDRQRAF